jgi:hypothetical protein
MNKIRFVVPLKLPSENTIVGKNRFALHSRRNEWHDIVQKYLWASIPSEQLRYFKERLGVKGVTYTVTITGRLFRYYDGRNPFPKWGIDALKGILFKDDSMKWIGEPIVKQELIPYAKRKTVPALHGKKIVKITKYYDDFGKQLFPETIIEVELVERQESLL